MLKWLKQLLQGNEHRPSADSLNAAARGSRQGEPSARTDISPFDKEMTSPSGSAMPRTLQAELANPYLTRPRVFDPALLQYNAIRAGEPVFDPDEEGERWHAVRARVLHHILAALSRSPARDKLVLRGSMLLAFWFGAAARRPADLDLVVTPAELSMTSPEARRLLMDIETLLRGSRHDGEYGFMIPDAPFVSEEIWIYDKAPGQRLIVPWNCEDERLNGTIQMDLVFGELIPSPPVEVEFLDPDNDPVTILAATQAQSLAWKLLWLETDLYGQGKDLYDAVLLAESTTVDAETLRKTFAWADIGAAEFARVFNQTRILRWNTEWEEFQKEYPQIQGSEQEWKNRLVTALKPLLMEST